jgi:hypothetical protein
MYQDREPRFPYDPSFLGKDSWKRFLEKILGKDSWKRFLEKILGKTMRTASLHNQVFQELLGRISYK